LTQGVAGPYNRGVACAAAPAVGVCGCKRDRIWVRQVLVPLLLRARPVATLYVAMLLVRAQPVPTAGPDVTKGWAMAAGRGAGRRSHLPPRWL
jgi:hypothetical protein